MSEARKQSEPGFLTRRWRAALYHAGVTQAEWARQFDWTDSHVSQVVSGKRESEAVMAKVTAFIELQESAIARRVASDVSAGLEATA